MSASESPEPGAERTLRSTTRNPRRRQRPSENDTLKTSAPRRKRNKISDETFRPRQSTEAPEKENAGDVEIGSDLNGHLPLTTTHVDIPLRGKRSSVRKATRNDGATVLAHNQCYTVKLLPSTPKDLQVDGLTYRGTLGNSSHALAITREKALIWDYSAHASATNTRTFGIPFSTSESDPLPFGALVPDQNSPSDAGLLLVSATKGDVIFYESIERAASLGLLQEKQAGVEGNIGSLFSGETVVDLVPADHAGFVIALSSGRILQLTLRDAQGKAKITAHFLRAQDSGSGGLLGSFKGLWTAGFRRDLSAIRARPLGVRGQTQLISATEKAELLMWKLEWSGRTEFEGVLSLREKLVSELRAFLPVAEKSFADSTILLDFAISDTTSNSSREVALANAFRPMTLALLLQYKSNDSRHYVLSEVNLDGENVEVSRLVKLESYSGSYSSPSATSPKMLLPKPGHTAFVSFTDALVLATAREFVVDGPDQQLRTTLSDNMPFEEAIYLRPGRTILDVREDDCKAGQSVCVAFIQGLGLARIIASDTSDPLRDEVNIPAKTRIEEAVFYGVLQDNIIEFGRRPNPQHAIEEVETAALAISNAIVRADPSYNSFISTSPTSIEQHLFLKARALKALVDHVRNNYPAVSRSTMWALMWDAEKIAAGQQLWTMFEDHVKSTTAKGKRKATLMDEMCAWLEDELTQQRPDLKEEDLVRKFFIAGLHRLEKVLNNVRVFLEDQLADTQMPADRVLRLVQQANDIWLITLQTAFTFRTENAAAYGVPSALITDGVLVNSSEYRYVPEFWTSSEWLTDATISVATLSREFARRYFEGEEQETEVENLARKISEMNPDLIQIYCTQVQECIRWLASRTSPKDREHAERLELSFQSTRYNQLRSLAVVGQADAGMRLAESFRDMETLTDMVVAESQYFEEALKDAMEDVRPFILQSQQELEVRISRYFERYGDEWANAFFSKGFSGDFPGLMLVRAQHKWKEALTKYLRGDPSRAKICWINDIEKGDFQRASRSLALTGQAHESHLWAKKVELSMSSLALLAAEEDAARNDTPSPAPHKESSTLKHELTVVAVQERLYKHLEDEVITSLDREAALELCMQKFGTGMANFGKLHELLLNGFSMVIDHLALSLEELIDVLTLMDNVQNDELAGNLQGGEFKLALVALNAMAASIPPKRFEMLLHMIWKRCYIHNEWDNIKLSNKRSDAERSQVYRQTSPWHTYYQLLASDFLKQPHCRIRVIFPSECIGAACDSQDIAYRFPEKDLREPIVRDIVLQDEILREYVSSCALDDIAHQCYADAQGVLTVELDEQAELHAAERLLNHEEDSAADDRMISATEDKISRGTNGTNGTTQIGLNGSYS